MKRYDLTQGTIWKQIIRFALPLLASSFVQLLYNTIDLLFAGVLGKEASAAVGASSLVITCIVGFFTGISVGNGVVVSQAVGEKNTAKIGRAVQTGVKASLIGGIILTVIGITASRRILIWMQTPADILSAATDYARCYLLCMTPLVLYNMNAGIIRATGDSKTPMLAQLVGGVINVILDALVIFVFQLGLVGIALASTVSQGIAALITLRYLLQTDGAARLHFAGMKIDYGILKEILRIGAPAGLQSLVITLSNVFVQSKINGFGVNEIAAFASYFKVELLIYLPIVAIGQAAMTFTGQNIGANQFKRVKKGVRVCIAIGITYAACAAGLLLLFGKQVFWLFNRDIGVVSCGLCIIRATFPFYWIYVVLEVLSNAIRGSGRSISPMILILLNICVLRTLFLFLFTSYSMSLEAVAATYPTAWFTAAVSFLLYWRGGRVLSSSKKGV